MYDYYNCHCVEYMMCMIYIHIIILITTAGVLIIIINNHVEYDCSSSLSMMVLNIDIVVNIVVEMIFIQPFNYFWIEMFLSDSE